MKYDPGQYEDRAEGCEHPPSAKSDNEGERPLAKNEGVNLGADRSPHICFHLTKGGLLFMT